MREFLRQLYLTLRHLSPDALNKFVTDVGPAKFYAVIFAIIFCETGLVVTPFLPGDSLLFAIGAVGAHPDSPFHLPLMGAMVVLAALLGDNTQLLARPAARPGRLHQGKLQAAQQEAPPQGPAFL